MHARCIRAERWKLEMWKQGLSYLVVLFESLKSKILAKSLALNRSEIFDPRNRATKGFLQRRVFAAGPLVRSLAACSINPPSLARDTLIQQLGQMQAPIVTFIAVALIKTAIIITVMRAMQNRCRNQLVAPGRPGATPWENGKWGRALVSYTAPVIEAADNHLEGFSKHLLEMILSLAFLHPS